MKIKTYAARGLLDFNTALDMAGAIMRISFTGGYMGQTGVISAKYTTDDPAIQKIIEDSKQFKSGRIYLFSSKEPVSEKPTEKSK